jgi:pseudouridine-5'-phosphate glycosidase
LDQEELEQIATRDDVVKTSIRDLATVSARKGFAATTVAATSHLAMVAGIEVFATGGLGGVHRYARESWDESADLTALSLLPITIVCSGVKSILDVGATLERLETLNVGVLVYGSHQFPGFYLSDSGFYVDWSLGDPSEIADVMAARRALQITSGLVIANPLPLTSQLDPDLHDQVLSDGLKLVDSKKISGKDVTPFLLDHFHRATHGQSLVVNTDIIVRNADLAARIAVANSLVMKQA